MIERKIGIDGLSAAIRRQAALAPRAVRIGLIRAARRSEAYMVAESSKFADTGIFMAAWDVEETVSGAILLNDAPHAAPVEEGRRAAYPPLVPIFEYLCRKSGVSSFGITPTAKWDLSDHPMFAPYVALPESDSPAIELVRRHAVALGRWLGTHDLPGKHVMTNALSKMGDFARQEIEKALREAERQA